MAGRADRDAAVFQTHAQRGAKRALGAAPQRLVERSQDRRRAGVVPAREPGSMSEQSRQRRSADALAGDVTDDREPARVRFEHLVEVTTYVDPLLASRRPVQGRELPTRNVRQRPGQQTPLKRVRDLRERRVKTRVLDRDRGSAAKLLGQFDVIVPQTPARLRGHQRHHSHHSIRHSHGHDQHRANLQRSQQSQVVLALGGCRQLLLGHVGVEL